MSRFCHAAAMPHSTKQLMILKVKGRYFVITSLLTFKRLHDYIDTVQLGRGIKAGCHTCTQAEVIRGEPPAFVWPQIFFKFAYAASYLTFCLFDFLSFVFSCRLLLSFSSFHCLLAFRQRHQTGRKPVEHGDVSLFVRLSPSPS